MSLARKAVLAVLAVLLIAYVAVVRLVVPSILAEQLPKIKELSREYLNGTVSVESLEFSEWLSLTARKVLLVDDKGKTVANADSVVVDISILKALANRTALGAIGAIDVVRPDVELELRRDDTWNLASLPKHSDEESNTDFKGLIRLQDGKFHITSPYGKWRGSFSGSVDAANDPSFGLDITAATSGQPVRLQGSIATDTLGNLTVSSKSFDLREWAPLIAHYAPIYDADGRLAELHLRWSNDGKEVGMDGNGLLQRASARLEYEKEKIPVCLDGKVEFKRMSIIGKKLLVEVAGEKAIVDGNIDLKDLKKPRAEDLQLTLDKFNPHKVLASVPVDGAISGSILLNGTPEKIKAEGEFSAPTLLASGIRLYDIYLPIAMEGDTIKIPGATAGQGKGRLELNCEYDQELKHLAGIISADKVDVAQLAGATEHAVLDGEAGIEGTVEKGKLKVTTLANIMQVQWRNHSFHSLAADVDLTGNKAIVNGLSGFCDQGGAFIMDGSVIDGQCDLAARLTDFPIGPVLRVAKENGYGSLSGKFAVTGPLDSINVRGVAALTDSELYGMRIKDAHGLINLQGNDLTMKDLHIILDQGQHMINGKIALGGAEPVFDLKVVSRNVRIDPLSDLYNPELKITGDLDNDVVVKGALSNISVKGTAKASNGSFKGLLMDEVRGNYDYGDGELDLKNVKIRTLGTEIDADGIMNSQGKLRFTLDARKVRLRRLPHVADYADIDGSMDFKGVISGTREKPMIAGILKGPWLSINGERLSDLNFIAASINGDTNVFEGAFHQDAGGDYVARIAADFAKKLFMLKARVKEGDVASLLRMSKTDLAVRGKLTGNIQLDKRPAKRQAFISGRIDDLAIRNVGFTSSLMKVTDTDGVWKIEALEATEADGGVLRGKGMLDQRQRQFDVEFSGTGITNELLAAFMKNPVKTTGEMDFTINAKGSMDNPEGTAVVKFTPGTIDGVPFDTIEGNIVLKDDMYTLNKFFVARDKYNLSAQGQLPGDLLRKPSARIHPDACMDIKVDLNNADMDFLQHLFKGVTTAHGDTVGILTIGGTLESPSVHGDVRVVDGYVKLKDVKTPIEHINVETHFNGKDVTLTKLAANIGKGVLQAQGRYSYETEDTPYALTWQADKVSVESKAFSGTINATGSITHKKRRPHIKADITLDDVLLNITSVPEFGGESAPMGLDVKLNLGPKIHMYNSSFYDLWLAGSLDIKGSTRFPLIEGMVKATKGTISYLRTRFDVKTANVTFPFAGSFTPSLTLEAETKFRRYLITARYSGLVDDNMDIQLSSLPAKTRAQLLRMLTLKTDTEGSSISGDDMQGLMDAGLEMTFLGDVEDYIKNGLGLREFRIYTGNVRSGIGFDVDSFSVGREGYRTADRNKYNILLSKEIFKNLIVGFSFSFTHDDRSFFAQYDISRKLSFNISRSKKDKEEYKNWVGLYYVTPY